MALATISACGIAGFDKVYLSFRGHCHVLYCNAVFCMYFTLCLYNTIYVRTSPSCFFYFWLAFLYLNSCVVDHDYAVQYFSNDFCSV